MRARQAICHALIFSAIPLVVPVPTRGDEPAPKVPKPAPARAADAPQSPAPALPALPKDEAAGKPAVTGTAFTPGSRAEVARSRLGAQARLDALGPAEKDTPASKAIREVLTRRLQLLAEWEKAAKERDEAEHPTPSPEQVAAELKAELEKTRALLDQSHKTPDALLPDAFGTPAPGTPAKSSEARLADMKEAIEAARGEIKERSTELEALRGDGSKNHGGEVAVLRGTRDKIHQEVSALAAGRLEREAAIANAGSAEARELARDRFTNSEWESRVVIERLAAADAQVTLAAKRTELGAAQIQAKTSRGDLNRHLLDLMEKRYASQSERQQIDLKQAVAKEETKAAQTNDILEHYRAKRSAELLELEAQAVAFEKASATTQDNLSVAEQTRQADLTGVEFEKLKELLTDGNVTPLDILRLKNGFRRIGPERAKIVRGELAKVKGQLTTYENALADAEINLVNDSRDDQYDREALLEKLPQQRHHAAEVMLDAMELRHRDLLNRSRDVLQKLAQRADDTQFQILRRIRILDEQYAFIRTHIFWVRDAEPVGPAIAAHARDEAVRGVRALAKLACEPWDRSLWGKVSVDFIIAAAALVLLPWPLRLGQKAMDRLRLAAPDPGMTPENAPSPVVG